MDWQEYTYTERLKKTLADWMVKLGSGPQIELSMHAESADKKIADLTRQLEEEKTEYGKLKKEYDKVHADLMSELSTHRKELAEAREETGRYSKEMDSRAEIIKQLKKEVEALRGQVLVLDTALDSAVSDLCEGGEMGNDSAWTQTKESFVNHGKMVQSLQNAPDKLAFAREIEGLINDTFFDGVWEVDTQDLVDLALKCNLVRKEIFDPDKHPNTPEFDLKKGDTIYVWNRPTPSAGGE